MLRNSPVWKLSDRRRTGDYLKADILSAIELADYEAEESGEEKPVNEFYTWLLGAEKVNEILHDYCKDVATEEDIRKIK